MVEKAATQDIRVLEARESEVVCMWCALLPSSRPDSTVVVCAGRNWAALGSPFFYLCCISLWRRRMKQPSRIKSIALLLRSIRQKLGVLGFTGVIGSRQARCQTPFIQRLVATVADPGSCADAPHRFKSERDGIWKV